MKMLVAALLTLSSVNAFAYGSIVVPVEKNEKVEIAWLGTEVDQSEVEAAWTPEGQEAVFNGKICYKGQRKQAIQVLKALNEFDFLGDEYRLQDIHYAGREGISYEVYDGPNETVISDVVISACK